MKIAALSLLVGSQIAGCAPPCRDARCSKTPVNESQRHATTTSAPAPATPEPTSGTATVAPAGEAPKEVPPEKVVVTDSAAIDLKPAGESLRSPLVVLTAPAIDASADLKIDIAIADAVDVYGRGYTITNQGTEEISLYQWAIEGTSERLTSTKDRALTHLKPGEQLRRSVRLTRTGAGTQAQGSYRLILMAFYRAKWGDPRTLVLTDAGKQVDAVFRAVERRLDAASLPPPPAPK